MREGEGRVEIVFFCLCFRTPCAFPTQKPKTQKNKTNTHKKTALSTELLHNGKAGSPAAAARLAQMVRSNASALLALVNVPGTVAQTLQAQNQLKAVGTGGPGGPGGPSIGAIGLSGATGVASKVLTW